MQVNCEEPGPTYTGISITNVYLNPLPKTCFDVLEGGQTFLFTVCDNDFQAGFPASHPACDDGIDSICNDEDPTLGSVSVTVLETVYLIEVGKTPLNITPDSNKVVCNGGPACSLTFTNASQAKPWFPWEVTGGGSGCESPPDGIVDLPNDILCVVLHHNQSKP